MASFPFCDLNVAHVYVEDHLRQLCDADSLVALRKALVHSHWLVREASLQTLVVLFKHG